MEKHRLRKEVDTAMQKMAQMSTHDGLTGLKNRRYIEEALEREVAGAKRYATDLSFCMMDLDRFKIINDTYGHAAGDRVLKEVARTITASFRQNDIFGRYGGEEFVVILPNTRIESARNVCERFREKVAQLVLKYDTYQLQTSISIGLTSYNRAENQSPADLILKADKALYRAKDQGRNRVEIELASP